MLIVMRSDATEQDVDRVCDTIQKLGFDSRPIPGAGRTAIGIVGNDGAVDPGRFVGLPGVKDAIVVSAPYKQVSREWRSEDTVVTLPNGTKVGGGNFAVMAGPCSVESRDQIFSAAATVAEYGGTVLRGGAFKPRTSPYSFQGVGEEALKWMREAADAHGLCVVTETVDEASARLVEQYGDVFQVGARNMQNYALLNVLGEMRKPVLLKRGMSATIKEWLLAAEYLLRAGNTEVILCERGIRSFDSTTRNVLDLSAVSVARSLTHLPVIADPSHGTGLRDHVIPMSRAAAACGADGVIVEMHPVPEEALSDGAQSLRPAQFGTLMEQLHKVVPAVGGTISKRAT